MKKPGKIRKEMADGYTVLLLGNKNYGGGGGGRGGGEFHMRASA